MNDRYFLFHVGMGFDAAVVQQVERRSELKRWASHALFVWAALDTAVRHYDRSRPRLAVHHHDGRVIDDGYQCLCFNTTPFTYLGTVPIDIGLPDAGLDHNGLVVMTVRTLRVRKPITALLFAALRGHPRTRHPLVDYRTEVQEVRVTGHGPFPYQLDGDYLGEVDTLRFRYAAEALALVLPLRSLLATRAGTSRGSRLVARGVWNLLTVRGLYGTAHARDRHHHKNSLFGPLKPGG